MNFLAWFTPKGYEYNFLPGDNDGKGSSKQTSTAYSCRGSLFKTVLACLFVLSSFLAGRLSMSVPKSGGKNVLGLETRDQIFQYNRTFGEAPSNASDVAWESLFPQHGGFFVHPELAPKRSAFSVFHQLHCLDELRHRLYMRHQQARSETDSAERGGQPLQEDSLGHIRHCIDLLRQSLMCNADLTIELKNEELGGVTGFGTVHRCVGWPGLLEWIQPYEATDAPPIPQEHDHTN